MINKNNILSNIKYKDTIKLTVKNETTGKLRANIFKYNDKIYIPDQIVVGDKSGKLYATNSYLDVNHGDIDKKRNILYSGTYISAILKFDIFSETISYIGNVSNGDNLPSSRVIAVKVDSDNNMLYAVGNKLTDGFLWVYDMNTDTGTALYTSSTGTQKTLHNLVIGNNGVIYLMGDQEGFYKYENGSLSLISPIPLNGTTYGYAYYYLAGSATDINLRAMLYDSDRDIIYIATGSGIFIYYVSVNESKRIFPIDTINGQTIPSEIKSEMTLINGNIYVPTFSGIWVYNVDTNTGQIIDTTTLINGDPLPSNETTVCYYNDYDNKLYVSTIAGLWRYDISTNTGELLGSVASGDARPTDNSIGIFIYGSLFEIFPNTTNQIWRWNEYIVQQGSGSNSGIEIISGGGTSYSEIVEAIKTRPIEISKLIYFTQNEKQKEHNLIPVYKSPQGEKKAYQINIKKYVTPEYPFNTIHINLEKKILADFKHYIEMDIEGNTEVIITFFYRQVESADIIKQANKNI